MPVPPASNHSRVLELGGVVVGMAAGQVGHEDARGDFDGRELRRRGGGGGGGRGGEGEEPKTEEVGEGHRFVEGNTCFKFKFKEVVMLWFRHGPVKETREGGALLRTLRE
jgi:hypothetical protein